MAEVNLISPEDRPKWRILYDSQVLSREHLGISRPEQKSFKAFKPNNGLGIVLRGHFTASWLSKSFICSGKFSTLITINLHTSMNTRNKKKHLGFFSRKFINPKLCCEVCTPISLSHGDVGQTFQPPPLLLYVKHCLLGGLFPFTRISPYFWIPGWCIEQTQMWDHREHHPIFLSSCARETEKQLCMRNREGVSPGCMNSPFQWCFSPCHSRQQC